MNATAPRLGQALRITVEVVQGHHTGLRQVFDKAKWKVGRGPENELILGQDIKVSRTHLEVQSFATQVIVKNLNEKNAMLVDGRAVNEAILRSNSHVQVGDSVLKFSFQAADAARPQMKVVNNQGAAAPMGGFQMPPNMTGPRTVDTPLLDNPRVRFYGMIGIVGLFALWIASGNLTPKKEVKIRDSVAINTDVAASEAELKKAMDERKDAETPQFRAAQSQFVKGFRDYQQGQYSRAMESFQSARAYYPSHVLAAKYWTLSKRKFDERVQAYMVTGRRYLGTKNYRMCQSSFAAVMMQIKDDKNPIYREAKQFFDECQVKGLGP